MDLANLMDYSCRTHSLFCQLPKIEVTKFYPRPSPFVLHIVDINDVRHIKVEDLGLGESFIRKFDSQGYLPFLWLRFGRNGCGVFTNLDNAISGVCIEKGNLLCNGEEPLSVQELGKIRDLSSVCSVRLTAEQLGLCHSLYNTRLRIS